MSATAAVLGPTLVAPASVHVSQASRGERRAIVVGASSGMGAALVRALCREGYRVAALARRSELLQELERELACVCERAGGYLFVHAHDVIESGAVPDLFERCVRELGGLDLFLFAAGIMPKVGREEYDTEKDLAMLSVNTGGCIAWCNEVAKLFRTQRHGTIVAISSIAGDRGRKGNPVYGASKAAMDHYLEALRNRLAEVGVHVCTIKPGYVETAMTAGMGALSGMISADAAAAQILSAARWRWNTRYVPLRWWLVGRIIKSIPSFVFKKLSI